MVGSLKKHFQTRFCPANIFLSLMFTNAHMSHQLLTSEIKIKIQTRRLLLQSIVRPHKEMLNCRQKVQIFYSDTLALGILCRLNSSLPKYFFTVFFFKICKRQIDKLISVFFFINLFWIKKTAIIISISSLQRLWFDTRYDQQTLEIWFDVISVSLMRVK